MRRRSSTTIALLWVCLGSAACAGIAVRPVSDAKNEKDAGIRFYQSAPYLLIKTDNKGGVTGEILWLPDVNQRMSAYAYSYLATNDTTLKFSNGMMTSATSEVDTSAIPKALLTTIVSLAEKAMNDPNAPKRVAPGPSLYRIRVKGTMATLIGDDGDIDINFGEAK